MFKKKTCGSCNRKVWFVKKREYIVPEYFGNKPITSNNELCRHCYIAIKKKLNIK